MKNDMPNWNRFVESMQSGQYESGRRIDGDFSMEGGKEGYGGNVVKWQATKTQTNYKKNFSRK